MIALCTGCQERQEPLGAAADNIIFILVDALRADHLGCYGYARVTSPNIDALAAEGTRFDNAISPSPWTLPTMGTIWTSLYPSVHGATRASNLERWMLDRKNFRPVSTLHESRTTLAEVLRSAQFATSAYVGGSYPGKVFGFGQGFDEFVEDEPYNIRFETEALLAWLDTKQPERFFAYIHTLDVHSPYSPPGVSKQLAKRKDAHARRVRRVLAEERTRYGEFEFDPGYQGPANGSWEYLRQLARDEKPDPRDIEHVIALYDSGIAYTDYWIGELIKGLKERGLYDRTVVIVTSDHGDEFLDHGGLEHGSTYYDEMLRVPLVVRVPTEGMGVVIGQQVGLIDLMPTILDLMGVHHNLELQGLSLRPLLRGRSVRERFMFAEASMVPWLKAAVRTNERKYILQEDRQGEELYDLKKDPHETKNLCRLQKRRCDPWAEEIRRWQSEMNATAERLALPTAQPALMDDKTRERLRALGYAE